MSGNARPAEPAGDRAAAIRHAIAPTAAEISRMPFTNNAAVAGDLLKSAGTRVVDVGCGDGKFTRSLAGFFPDVSGIDVKESKLAIARNAASSTGLSIDFRSGRGEELPFENGSLDVVVFSNSLHHMNDIGRALGEAARVLKSGGLLYVMEPVPAGNYYEATKLVNDETAVRTDAYQALLDTRDFSPVTEIAYRGRRSFANFAEWRNDQIDRDPKRSAKFEAHGDEARRRFEANADRADGRLSFDQVSRVNLLRKTS